jgi:YD repeat-containing protein
MVDRLVARLAVLMAAALVALSASPALCAASQRDVFYTYDVLGHQLTAKFDSATGADRITNAYNGFGELISSTISIGGVSKTVAGLFDPDGNRTRLTFPDANVFTYAYDGLDRESGILQGTATNLATISYDPLGRRVSLARTGAGKTAYAYDNASRLQSLTDQLGSAAGGTNDQAFTFGYYASDQIRTKATSNTAYA